MASLKEANLVPAKANDGKKMFVFQNYFPNVSYTIDTKYYFRLDLLLRSYENNIFIL